MSRKDSRVAALAKILSGKVSVRSKGSWPVSAEAITELLDEPDTTDSPNTTSTAPYRVAQASTSTSTSLWQKDASFDPNDVESGWIPFDERNDIKPQVLLSSFHKEAGSSTADGSPHPSSVGDQTLLHGNDYQPPREKAEFDPFSIGTQTDQKTEAILRNLDTGDKKSTYGKLKGVKLKNKSLQIDFEQDHKSKSLFKRSRSLTPTRYKKFINEGGRTKNGRSVNRQLTPTKSRPGERKRSRRSLSSSVIIPTQDKIKKPEAAIAKSKSGEKLLPDEKALLGGKLKGQRSRSRTKIQREIKVTKVKIERESDAMTTGQSSEKDEKGKVKEKERKKKEEAEKNAQKKKEQERKEKAKKAKRVKDDKSKKKEKNTGNSKDETDKSEDRNETNSKHDEEENKKTSREKDEEEPKNTSTVSPKSSADAKKNTPRKEAHRENDSSSREGAPVTKVEEKEKRYVKEDGDDITPADDAEGKRETDIELGKGEGGLEKPEEQIELIKDVVEIERLPDEDDENGMPAVDEDLEEFEQLFSNDSDKDLVTTTLDSETVKKIEEQIFVKIKFYKEVISDVKEKPWYLRKKMTLLKEANQYTARFEGRLSTGGGPSQIAQLKVTWAKMTREIGNTMALLVPWEDRIKHIETYFGSVVASYFTFLRWIFWTNIIQAFIIGVAIMMPEIIYGPAFGSVDYKTIPENDTETAYYLSTVWNMEGIAEHSPMFYGYYTGERKFASGFRMPLGYLIANLAIFAYCFIAILRQIAANAKDEKAADKDDNFTFSWKTFTSWDYMIGNEETAKNKFKSVVLNVREAITESKEAKKKITKKLHFMRFLANFLVFLILGSSTYAVYLTVERSKEFEQRKKTQGPDSVSWLEANEISIIMTLATTVFPILFDIIAGLEEYHPRVALQWSLARILILYLLNLYTLYIALYQKIQDIQKEATRANTTYYESFNGSLPVFCDDLQDVTTTLMPENITLANSTTEMVLTTPACTPNFIADTICWENMVGQELMKLTIFDMVTTVLVIYASEFFRALFIKLFNRCWCWDLERALPGYATFSLAENLLHLVYNQGMIWMGTLFCPGLPAFNLLKLLVMFYVRAWAVMVCNVPEERIFKAGSDNFYLLILLLMLYLVMIPIAFAMVSIRPSKICGPFREFDFMYLAFTEWLDEAFPSGINSVMSYIASPGALIPIFILLFLILYYLKSSNAAMVLALQDLKKQLNYERTEGKKKVFNMQSRSPKKKPENQSIGDLSEIASLKRTGSRLSLNSQGTGKNPPMTLSSLVNTKRFVNKLRAGRTPARTAQQAPPTMATISRQAAPINDTKM